MEYAELHCHSYFSLLDGTASPAVLVERATALGMPALALTDHNALYGAIPFTQAAQDYGIKPIYGAELTLTGDHHLTLLVEDESGWRNLCRLISLAQHKAPKGQAALPQEVLADHSQGLIALSGCRQGEIAAALLCKDWDAALAAACRYRNWFGADNFWLEVQNHLRPADEWLIDGLAALARQTGLGYVATNNVHYLHRADGRLQDMLVCIRHQTSLTAANGYLRPNSEFYLKPGRQLFPLFAAHRKALRNSLLIADRCQFALTYGLQDLPTFPTPPGLDAIGYLCQLCYQAIPHRYSSPSKRLYGQLEHELTIIANTGLANYFLIVWDIVSYAHRYGIRCQGRGSAANSLVAYLLKITPIDPLAHDLVFERFLSAERGLPPDIDLDLQADRREEVIQYVYGRYGTDHAAMACTLVTFRRRSALRDVGKALGLSETLILEGARRLRDNKAKEDEDSGPENESNEDEPDALALLLDFSQRLAGLPRHLGLHNGGMILTGSPLSDRLPTEPAAMADRVVVQWDKDALETASLVKIDLLGLRMLSAIAEAETIIKKTTGCDPGLDRLTFDDPAVYRMIAEGDTIGVFQVESRAQAQVLPRIRPACFDDLIVTISLIRPGPIQGNMVRPYLRRRMGLEAVSYPHPLLKDALADTLGVILFQEQVLKVARDLAGFSEGQGEQLRRALGSKYATEAIGRFRHAFIDGAAAKGVPSEIAETVFEQLTAFGSYSFPKSHAAAFAVLVYQSAWLKRYHPHAFYVALLNNQPMGFWSPAVIGGDARRHQIQTLAVDINLSRGKCSIEGDSIRLGFNYINGLGEASIARIEAAQQAGDFLHLADFCQRTRLARRLVEKLILAGAFDSFKVPRRALLWALGRLDYQADKLDLRFPADTVDLPPLSQAETMSLEYAILGLSPGEQVMSLYRPWLNRQGILDSQALIAQPDGQLVRIAGQVVVHQSPPTAKGFHFITLEDEAGLMDLIIRPKVYDRYRELLHSVSLLLVEGRVQHQNGVVNLLVKRAAALPRSI